MGQYYRTVNIDKNEFLHPHELGDGLKLMEFGMSGRGTLSALAALLILDNQGKGPWAGDRIVIAGDYADEGRFVPKDFADMNLYSLTCASEDNERAEQGLPPAPVFRSVTAEAKSQLSFLGITEFVVGERESKGIPALFEDRVYDQPEDVFEMLNAPITENLKLTIGSVCRSLRCYGVDSGVSWQSINDVQLTLDEETGRSTRLDVLWQHKDTGAKFATQLEFPATSAQVRRFLKVNDPKTPALKDATKKRLK